MTYSPPAWNQQAADRLIGSTVLVGITEHGSGAPATSQFHGTVIDAGPEAGITLRLGGDRTGEQVQLPPDPNAFHPARPGHYRLRGSGDVVVDPDFTATWDVTTPQHD